MNIDIYSTVASELPKMVEKKEPMCFVPYEQFLEYKREMEDEIKELKKAKANCQKLVNVIVLGDE